MIDYVKRTTPETVETLLECIAGAGDVRAQKMFGEYAVYCDEKVVALACSDELFVKNTDAGREIAPSLQLLPAYPSAKPGLHVPKDRWDDTIWMAKLIRITADALPRKKTKK